MACTSSCRRARRRSAASSSQTSETVALRSREPGVRPGTARQRRRQAETSSRGGRLLCRRCRAQITSDAERLDVEGRHLHRRINPAGIPFEFGCFGAASGGEVVGPPTTEYSWFSGHAWSYCLCRRCSAHLGWYFEGGEPPPFFGLILDRLIAAEDGLGDS